MFSRLGRTETSVDRAAKQMAEAILSGELACSDTLPPERRLAEQLGINRGTVRSALNRLGALGLVEPRQGAGHRVLDFRRFAGPALLSTWLRSLKRSEELHSVFFDLFELRRALALVVFKRLSNVDGQAVAKIEEAIGNFKTGVDARASARRIAELDVEVLGSIVDASGSLVFQLFLNPISQVLNSFSSLTDAIYSDPAGNLTAYQAVLAAIKSGDSHLAELVETLLEERDRETLARWAAQEKKQ